MPSRRDEGGSGLPRLRQGWRNRTALRAPISAGTAACPVCGCPSGRFHNHCRRCSADLPWQGPWAEIRVRARRFRCAMADCPRRFSTKCMPKVGRPWARRTARLGDIQHRIGLACGGRPGARLAERLATPASGDTLLRLVEDTPASAARTPRLLGVGDWAWRPGIVNLFVLTCTAVLARAAATPQSCGARSGSRASGARWCSCGHGQRGSRRANRPARRTRPRRCGAAPRLGKRRECCFPGPRFQTWTRSSRRRCRARARSGPAPRWSGGSAL